jgi:hypothetical protein
VRQGSEAELEQIESGLDASSLGHAPASA